MDKHFAFEYGLNGIVVRRRAYDPRVIRSILALGTFEESNLRQVFTTNCASLHTGI